MTYRVGRLAAKPMETHWRLSDPRRLDGLTSRPSSHSCTRSSLRRRHWSIGGPLAMQEILLVDASPIHCHGTPGGNCQLQRSQVSSNQINKHPLTTADLFPSMPYDDDLDGHAPVRHSP